MNPYLKAVRPERWPRSLAIFLGSAAFFFLNRSLLTSFSAFEILFRLVLSFLLTWAISTANYVINEIADTPFDIHHPTKRLRPLITGQIKKIPFCFLGLTLMLAGLIPAFFLFPWPFLLSLLALLAAGIIYNVKPLRTKDIPFLDSVSESVNNPIRFLIGWYTFSPAFLFPSWSLLVGWWAFGNFLMVGKRLSEFRFLKEKAADYRSSHKKYTKNSLLLGMIASAALFFACYFFYTWKLRLNYFIYISPVILLFILLIFRKTFREQEVMEEPEKLLIQPAFALYSTLLLILFILGYFLERLGY